MQRNCRSLRHRWRCKQHPNGAINAGLLVFAPILLAIAQVLDPPEPRFAQWLASLLLGALNIEQSKFLNWQDLTDLLGSVVRFPHPQRQELERLATPTSFEGIARFNGRQLKAGEQSDFYLIRTPSSTPARRMCFKDGVRPSGARTKRCTAILSTQ